MGREHSSEMETTPPVARLGGGRFSPSEPRQKGRYLRPAPQSPQPTGHTQRTTSSDPLFHRGETRRVVCVCVRVDDRFHCRTSWLFCRGSASCDRPTAQNPRVLGNFSRKIILPRIRVRSPSEQAATRTVRNHLRQCESSRELVILKLVRCNAINETGKGKKRFSPLSSASCSRSSVSPGGWSVCLAARG